jgi:16S rRNA processing protein RimM
MLEVAASRPHKHRWIVSFVGIGDRTAAEGLVGAVLRAEPIDDPDALWVHELIGCEVVDVDGVLRGRVEAVEQNPASDLLVLDSGALVPLRFLVDGPAARRLVVDVPTGLFDV